jgi:prepilin-type N-terminal cleavage/methylation domain-containing protein
MKTLSNQRGITLIELMLVIGIMSLLFAIGIVSLSSIQIVATRSSAATVLISDLKTQQIKAMVGDTEGRGVPDNYGIKVLNDQYVMFHGNSYNPLDTANFSVPVPDQHSLTSTFGDDTILFASDSGEVVDFSEGSNSVTITNIPSATSETIILNKYGTVTSFE